MAKKPRREGNNPDLNRPELAGPENEAIEADAATADAATADAATAEAAIAAAASDTFEQAADGIVDRDNFVPSEPLAEQANETQQAEPESQPAPKLERLQKILAQAGIASRRHAEELITQGRVQVNGTVVTELGSKADAARDHIRVDGKLLQGTERLRYFMLNKPRGFVTTVSDPEGRPTVMQFFSKMRERLYPVGRLDYISEGLLLVTNDGELANKLTRAASGVEKTYLVKVSGQPAEHDLDRLREGVAIDRGKPGSGRVPTAPAQIRRFHPGKGAGPRSGAENPWFEVVLIEGRNRELRKMFEEIGHHVEKIRRVGYGPLVLDVEPGKMRELEPEEIEDLRKAAEGKYRKPKQRDSHKRSAPAETQSRPGKPHWSPKRGGERQRDRSEFQRPDRRSTSGPDRSANRGMNRDPNRRPDRPENRGQFRTEPRGGGFRSGGRFEAGRPQRPPRPNAPERPHGENRENRPRFTPFPSREQGNGPAWKNKSGQGSRPPRFDRNRTERGGGARPVRSSDRRQPGEFRSAPPFERGPQRFGANRNSTPSDFKGRKRLDIRPTDEEFSAPREAGPQDRQGRTFQPRGGPRPASGRPHSNPRFAGKQRPKSDRDRPRFDRDRGEHPRIDRPQSGTGVRPQREDRPFSGPRAGGFKRKGAGGGRDPGSNRGSVRSGGGRRPGSRPGGKPGGGKRRP